MSTSFGITIPSNESELRDEIESELGKYARVDEVATTFNLQEIQLLVEIIAGATTVVANAAAVGTFLLLLRDRYKKEGKKSGILLARFRKIPVALEDLDENGVKELLSGE